MPQTLYNKHKHKNKNKNKKSIRNRNRNINKNKKQSIKKLTTQAIQEGIKTISHLP